MQIEGFRVFCSVTHTFEPDNYRYCVLVATNEKLNQVEWEEGVRKTTWNSKEFSGFVCIPRHSVLLSHSPSCKKKTSKKKGNKLVPVITAECLMTLVPESGFFFLCNGHAVWTDQRLAKLQSDWGSHWQWPNGSPDFKKRLPPQRNWF